MLCLGCPVRSMWRQQNTPVTNDCCSRTPLRQSFFVTENNGHAIMKRKSRRGQRGPESAAERRSEGVGTYLNPGNSGFAEKLNTDYVDKTGLISLINRTIGTNNKLTCISRPRRFGKSYAAQMLCAYYDRSCDSSALFAGLKISADPAFREYLNRFEIGRAHV